jgi:hypothetical protein
MQPADPHPVEPRRAETPVAEPSRDAPARIAVVPPPPVDGSPHEPPAPAAPEETLRSILAEAVLQAFKSTNPQAYLEKLARTDPQLFYKYMALLLPSPKAAATSNNILNVIGALPRTALDKLPEGFRIN